MRGGFCYDEAMKLSRAEFERFVAEGVEVIPQKFRDKIHNVVFMVEDEPSLEIRREHKLGPDKTLLGHYHGLPLSERGDLYGVGMTLPDTILIYQKPIEEEAAALVAERGGDFVHKVRHIVADTVWHEIAHHFGFDEREVRQREDERGLH